jgi:Protein of unknown function (DUF3455)
MNSSFPTAFVLAFLILPWPIASAEVPEAIAAPGETVIATTHAQGAQIYECKTDAAGKLVWQFREPIAALLVDGKTVGRHYAGPNWELADGSAVAGKVSGRAPGATAKDIPLLKLDYPIAGPACSAASPQSKGSIPRAASPKDRARAPAPS